MPYAMLERLYVAFGLPRPTHDERVREEDLRFIKAVPILFAAGVDEGDILRLARVWGDSARKVAQFQMHYLHHAIEEPFRRQGLGDNARARGGDPRGECACRRSGEDLLGWLFRRHSEKFEMEHMFEHLETALENAGVHRKQEHAGHRAASSPISPDTRG